MNFNHNITGTDDYRRAELINKIEKAVEHMTLKELEAVSYDLFTKGYIQDL